MVGSRWRRLGGVIGVLAASWLGSALAQDEEGPAEPAPPATATEVATTPMEEPRDASPAAKYAAESSAPLKNLPARIKYVGPDTYILLDSEGHPQPVPGMTYEDFMAAWKQAQNIDGEIRQPRFAIESVEVNGHASEQAAEVKLDVTVRLLADQPVEVPLGLVGTILQKQPEFGHTATPAGANSAAPEEGKTANNPHASYLDYQPERGGYVARFVGQPDERHTLSLQLLVPLLRNGTETTLPLNCPRALTSNLTLDVNPAVSDASVTNGSLLARETAPGGGTRIRVAGFAGQFRATWKTGEQPAAELDKVLSASGAIQVTIDGRSVQSEARLTVRSYGGSFDRLRIRLPNGAKLIQDRRELAEGKDPGYSTTVESNGGDSSAPREGTAAGQIVQVQFPEPQQGPVVVALSTEQPLGLASAASASEDSAAELGGFEVLGALRQFGDIALRAADDWQTRWDTGSYVRQVDASELDPSLRQLNPTAAFQYDRQPWSLAVRVAAPRSRVHVTPDYVLECSPEESRLRVHLTYQVLGTRAFKFLVNLQGWELTADPIESGGLVDRDRVIVTREGMLEMPLTQASSRRAEIAFYVRRSLSRDTNQISLPLPIPAAESIGTGDLIVRGGGGVELQPDLARSVGLTPTTVNDTSIPAGEDRDEFRFRCLLPNVGEGISRENGTEATIVPTFAADRITRSRDVSTSVSAVVEIGRTESLIDERVEYTVRFEPIRELSVAVPDELTLDEQQTEFVLLSAAGNGDATDPQREIPLSWQTVAGRVESAGGRRTYQVRVMLPRPHVGKFTIAMRFRSSHASITQSSSPLAVPLMQPLDGRLTAERVAVRTSPEFAVTLESKVLGSSWLAVAASNPAPQQPSQEFVARTPEISLPLLASAVDGQRSFITTVERVWLQIWLAGDVRQDRAVYRFHTAGPTAVVELPERVMPEEVEVLLDAQPAEVESPGEGRLVVQLPKPKNTADTDDAVVKPISHTLEMRYRRAGTEGMLARRRLIPPQLVGRTALAEVYWQIVLPGDLHVVEAPSQLASSSEWQWLGTFWGRRPTLGQAELEKWAGASSQLAPARNQNQYLFSGISPVSSIEMVFAPRWLIVLGASAVVLALTMAWIYVPGVRRGWLVFALACVLAGLAATYPTPAILLGQASVLGIVLSLLATWLARFTKPPAQWTPSTAASSIHRPSTPRTDSLILSPAASVASTAPTAPYQLPDAQR